MVPNVAHLVIVAHRWVEPELFSHTAHSYQTVEACLDCGTNRRCLRLTSRHDSLGLEDEVRQDPSQIRQLVDLVQRIKDALDDVDRGIFQGTRYSDLQHFADEMQLRYPPVNRNDVTFGLAAQLAPTQGRSKSVRKRVRSVYWPPDRDWCAIDAGLSRCLRTS